jgi:hypothetical protein
MSVNSVENAQIDRYYRSLAEVKDASVSLV